MFMMRPYMFSELSTPTADFKFSLPACVFSINITVYRLGFKSAANVVGHTHNAWAGLKPNALQKWKSASSNYKVKIVG